MKKTILELYLKQSKYEELWETAHGRGENLNINKEDLKHLLMDHASALYMLEDRGVTTVNPKENKINIKIKKKG